MGTVVAYVAALRFFVVRTLRRREFIDYLPYPKDRRRLRALLMILYGTGMRRAEMARLKVSDVDSKP